MTMEEKKAIMEKNLNNDPALKAEYQALAAHWASPEEAAKMLASDPKLSARYAAVMAKITNGVELEDEELDAVSGGLIMPLGTVPMMFQWLSGGVALSMTEPGPAGEASPQASTLEYDPSKGVSASYAIYNPANPVTASPMGLAGETSGKIQKL